MNAQRIYGLTADTLNVVSHKSFNKDGKYHRGCIAGIQIVRRVVLTVDGEANWGDLTAGLDPNTPIEVSVLPGGSITGDVDLSQREDSRTPPPSSCPPTRRSTSPAATPSRARSPAPSPAIPSSASATTASSPTTT